MASCSCHSFSLPHARTHTHTRTLPSNSGERQQQAGSLMYAAEFFVYRNTPVICCSCSLFRCSCVYAFFARLFEWMVVGSGMMAWQRMRIRMPQFSTLFCRLIVSRQQECHHFSQHAEATAFHQLKSSRLPHADEILLHVRLQQSASSELTHSRTHIHVHMHIQYIIYICAFCLLIRSCK